MTEREDGAQRLRDLAAEIRANAAREKQRRKRVEIKWVQKDCTQEILEIIRRQDAEGLTIGDSDPTE